MTPAYVIASMVGGVGGLAGLLIWWINRAVDRHQRFLLFFLSLTRRLEDQERELKWWREQANKSNGMISPYRDA